MGTEPLKRELEAIDQELESAMLRLAETTQRVDEVLAGFDPGDGETRRPSTIIPLHPVSEPVEDEAGSGANEAAEPADADDD